VKYFDIIYPLFLSVCSIGRVLESNRDIGKIKLVISIRKLKQIDLQLNIVDLYLIIGIFINMNSLGNSKKIQSRKNE
jgi:hypothetical protein